MTKILVVDDKPEIRSLLKKMLADDDYDVLMACSGEEALTLIVEKRPDLVLLDLKMPGMDGLQTLRKIKELDDSSRVIMISAFGTKRTVIEALKLGLFDYQPKPLSLNRLRISIRHALAS